IVAWYDVATARNAWLQHVLSNGSLRFAVNGIAASSTSSATEYRSSAAVAYDAVADAYVVAYEKSNTLQSLFGVGAQRFDASGATIWASAGVSVLPVAGNHASFINCLPGPASSAQPVWMQYSG